MVVEEGGGEGEEGERGNLFMMRHLNNCIVVEKICWSPWSKKANTY